MKLKLLMMRQTSNHHVRRIAKLLMLGRQVMLSSCSRIPSTNSRVTSTPLIGFLVSLYDPRIFNALIVQQSYSSQPYLRSTHLHMCSFARVNTDVRKVNLLSDTHQEHQQGKRANIAGHILERGLLELLRDHLDKQACRPSKRSDTNIYDRHTSSHHISPAHRSLSSRHM